MSRIKIPDIKGKALYNFLVANKKELIAQKKATIKYSDGLVAPSMHVTKQGALKGGGAPIIENEDGVYPVKMSCNAAWWCDSQMDVLTDKSYDNSIKDKGILIPHIADHIWQSTNHVGDTTAVYTQKVKLRDLGYDSDGTTTCAVMESNVREDYNPLAYKFYKNGKINQHSIGLMYVSIGMCINDEEYLPEYEMWQKYYPKVINKDLVDQEGYFWIVSEIKWIENSCVLFGANELTPVLSNNKSTLFQPSDDTDDEPQHVENKSMIMCPSCQTMFQASGANSKCPNCGQYVSLTSTQVLEDPFDLLKAIEQTKFI